MHIERLHSATGASNGPSYFPTMKFDEDGVIQTNHITAGLTVQIQGRLGATMPWVTLRLDSAGTTSNTASGYFLVPLFPEMRAVVTGASGSVDIFIGD